MLLGLSSCSSTYFIVLRENDSAKVITEIGHDNSYVNKLNASPIISNVNVGNQQVSFEINSIDSIGNYLTYHNPGFITFQNYEDSIIVQSGKTFPFANNIKSCCHITLRILPIDKFDAFDKFGKLIKAKRGHHNIGFWLSQTKKNQEDGKKNIYANLKRKN